jgi:four helix bundle protein
VDITARTEFLAVRVVHMARELAKDPIGRILVSQVVRSACSIGANVEEAQAADTRKEFARSLGIAKKEARETSYWLRVIGKAGLLPAARLAPLEVECDEVIRIRYAIVKKGPHGGGGAEEVQLSVWHGAFSI